MVVSGGERFLKRGTLVGMQRYDAANKAGASWSYPSSDQGVTFDPRQVLGAYACPTVGAHWLLATEGGAEVPVSAFCGSWQDLKDRAVRQVCAQDHALQYYLGRKKTHRPRC